LKRGREQFATGPVAKVDPQGRCGGVLVYDLQMIILKTTQVYPLYFTDSNIFVVAYFPFTKEISRMVIWTKRPMPLKMLNLRTYMKM
jgi:hypothetical protein